MPIDFVLPLRLAYERMKRALFGPADLVKWLVVGFSAWLAGLLEGGSGGWPGQWTARTEPEDFGKEIGAAMSRLLTEPVALALVLWIGLAVVVVVVGFTWLSSRGKFVFLDNVVHDRAAVIEPWKRYAVQGNSLFVWRLVFGLCVFAGLLALAAPAVLILLAAGGDFGTLHALVIASLVVTVVVAAIGIAYVKLFLENFVVPIMYRDGLRTNDAWRKFLPLLRREMGSFVLYGLFVLALAIATLIVLAAFGCLTCCLGFVLLVLPYVGAVVLLPVTYTYRALGPEFLAQFGPEFSVWGALPPASPEPPPAPVS